MYAQIVRFQLKPDASREHFLELTHQMLAWLRGRDGFVAYELYQGSEFWADRIVWTDERRAKEGLSDFLETSIAQQMLTMVESDYSSFLGEAVISG